MYIQKLASGVFTYAYLNARLSTPSTYFLCARVGSDYIAIKTLAYITNPYPTVVFDKEVKNPLWKQSMDIHMDKMPSATKMERKIQNVRWLNPEEIRPDIRFQVFEFISM